VWQEMRCAYERSSNSCMPVTAQLEQGASCSIAVCSHCSGLRCACGEAGVVQCNRVASSVCCYCALARGA
jgi:hypothetical protein